MHKNILAAIQQSNTLTYSQLSERATKRGLSLDELDEYLIRVMKDKNVKSTVRGEEIVYTWSPPKPRTAISHLQWKNDNYPVMDSSNDGSGIEADYSYMFLTPEELKQYKADAKGIPVHMLGKKRQRSGV